jgi:hypothetical protein
MNTLHGIGLAFWRCYAAEASFSAVLRRLQTLLFPSHDENCLDSCIHQTQMELARASRIPETTKMAPPVLSYQNCVCFAHFRSLGKPRDKSARWHLSGSWINSGAVGSICIRFKNVWSRCMIVDLLLSPSRSPCECRCLLLFHCIIVRLTDLATSLPGPGFTRFVVRATSVCFFLRLTLAHYASFVVCFCSIASWSG